MTSKESIIQYISDPMCPWCFAFTPIFDRIKKEFENNFRFTYIAGGLRLRPDEPPMDEEFKDMLCGYWETVEMETGHKFDIALVDNMNFAFNTEPVCRAMVTFRHLYPDQLFGFEKQLQKAFYQEGSDITNPETLKNIVLNMKLDPNNFDQVYNSEAIDDLLEQDIIYTKSFDKPLLPMIVIQQGVDKILIMKGYSEHKIVSKSLDSFLSGSRAAENSKSGPACELGIGC